MSHLKADLDDDDATARMLSATLQTCTKLHDLVRQHGWRAILTSTAKDPEAFKVHGSRALEAVCLSLHHPHMARTAAWAAWIGRTRPVAFPFHQDLFGHGRLDCVGSTMHLVSRCLWRKALNPSCRVSKLPGLRSNEAVIMITFGLLEKLVVVA